VQQHHSCQQYVQVTSLLRKWAWGPNLSICDARIGVLVVLVVAWPINDGQYIVVYAALQMRCNNMPALRVLWWAVCRMAALPGQ
jgi:hypothetical protein